MFQFFARLIRESISWAQKAARTGAAPESRVPVATTSGDTPRSSRALSPTQIELARWLRSHSPSLAEVYEGAIRALERRGPGHIRFAAHAVREIANALPEAISGVKRTGRLDYPTRLDEVRTIWLESGILKADLTSDALPSLDVTTITLSMESAKPILDLLREHHQARARPIEAARRMFEAAAPENARFDEALQPIMQQWLKVTKWFMKHAHDNGRCDADVPFDEFMRQFALFESTLMAISRQFYSNVGELDEILEDANS